jgi:hypothetical protein
MKTKIFQLLIGCLLIITSCSEDFITKENDKSRYTPETFYNTKDHAIQALNAAYSGLNGWANGYTWSVGIMHFVLGDDLYETGYAAGFGDWGAVSELNIPNTWPTNEVWNGYYANVLLANNAIDNIPAAQKVANDPNFTEADVNLYLGQAYFLRAFYYYNIAQYYGFDKVIIRKNVPKSESEYAQAPASVEEAFAFIESDLKTSQDLLIPALNTTPEGTYEKGRVTRGAATALLGKLYLAKPSGPDYAKAAAEFKKILPGIGDAAYGTYSLVDNYRDNFTKTTENNNESVFEIQFANINSQGAWSNNDVHWIFQNFTTNRTSNPDMWWNFAVPNFKLVDNTDAADIDEFESWIEGTDTIYDYRVYETFWGVPNGANFTYKGTLKDWKQQGWADETVVGVKGCYSIRKYAYDNTTDMGFDPLWQDVNLRIIRLADIMLLYAECLANTGDLPGAISWVQQVRNRANRVAVDQSHLYSTRAGMPGQLPTAAALMAAKGWTNDVTGVMKLIRHERYVEGFCEGWRKEDLKRWKAGLNDVKLKSGWKGYQSLIIPLPQDELDRNTLIK